MRILITGSQGQVGWELVRALAPLGEIIAVDHAHLDLADCAALRRTVAEAGPAVVVNAAAYTAVDRAEAEEGLATQINGAAPGVLAAEASRCGAAFIHYSTDYVFDGTKATPYTEADPVAPINAYGRSNLAGERAVAAVGGSYLILRTSWVYAARGHNFPRTILRLAAERDRLTIVDDQIGAPTWARWIAAATAAILAASRGDPAGYLGERCGIYHLACGGATSWYGFARALLAGAGGEGRLAELAPIPTRAYPTPAARPANSRLDCTRLGATFHVCLPPWETGVRLCFADDSSLPATALRKGVHPDS